jgi:hypothetical protein
MARLRFRTWTSVGLSFTAVGLLAVSSAVIRADDNGKQEDGEGKYANLAGLWWQWVFEQPAVDVNGTNTNPLIDSTGAYATAGQENGIGPANSYFFLAGTSGGDAARTVTVPAGKALFFPVINYDMDNASDPPTNYKVPEMRELAKEIIDLVIVSSLYARVDGQDLEIFRTKSPVYSYTLPNTNSFYAYFGLVGPQFEGTVKPAVTDGYWSYIPPLPTGSHVVEFGGANTLGFSLNVTYNLTVQ